MIPMAKYVPGKKCFVKRQIRNQGRNVQPDRWMQDRQQLKRPIYDSKKSFFVYILYCKIFSRNLFKNELAYGAKKLNCLRLKQVSGVKIHAIHFGTQIQRTDYSATTAVFLWVRKSQKCLAWCVNSNMEKKYYV